MLFNSIAGSGDIVSFDGISITTPPTKTTYTEGDTFDPTGMVVTMSFNNGALNKITNSYTVTPTAMTLEVTSVTISVTFGDETKTATLAVTVNERHEIVYSGTHTTEEIVLGGDHYTQTSMTGSGILSVYGTWTDTEIWLCGGGADGLHGGNNGKSHGGGGGYVAQTTSTTLSPGTYTVTVGAAASASTITKDDTTFLTANGAEGANGGSGGGAAGIMEIQVLELVCLLSLSKTLGMIRYLVLEEVDLLLILAINMLMEVMEGLMVVMEEPGQVQVISLVMDTQVKEELQEEVEGTRII